MSTGPTPPLTAKNLAMLEESVKKSSTEKRTTSAPSNPPLTAENLAFLERSIKSSAMVRRPRAEEEQQAVPAQVGRNNPAAAERAQPIPRSRPLQLPLPYLPKRRFGFLHANERPLFPYASAALGNPPAREAPSHVALPLAAYHQDRTRPGNMAAHLMAQRSKLDRRRNQAFRNRRKKIRHTRFPSLLARYRQDISYHDDEDELKEGKDEDDSDEDEEMLDAKSDTSNEKKDT
ncbi:hypothetical protein GGR57DRAFT_505771 [Xylariaceae sp. FL1272]|nr:hypothetical protein GGR57DRAFT_505771 [Xylariaceae sp. FL1272]